MLCYKVLQKVDILFVFDMYIYIYIYIYIYCHTDSVECIGANVCCYGSFVYSPSVVRR